MESPAELDPPVEKTIDPYSALRDSNYRRYISGWTLSTIGLLMMQAAVSWELYERTNSALALGLVGLFVAVPVICLALPAGHLADTRDRRVILILAQIVFTLCSLGLAAVSYSHAPVWRVYLLLTIAGTARAFGSPARGAMFPQVVSDAVFQNAVTWNSFVFHLSATIGPIAAGAIMRASHAAWPVFLLSAAGAFAFGVALFRVKLRPMPRGTDLFNLQSLLAGASHLIKEKSILAAITLDLFAVLFGGATALLPIYAKDILHVGPIGFGCLRAAPYVGAFLMAWALAHRPPFKQAGRSLLLSVAGFGGATILFGFSHWFVLSLICLLAAGALDNISVVIRHVLVQVRTPNALRGRVSAINTVFIDSSNELGGFESGAVAHFFGPVISVVSGGIGTILVVLGIAALWPEIRRLGRIDPRSDETVAE